MSDIELASLYLAEPTKGPTVEIEFTSEELRDEFSHWLDRHALEMFQDWQDGAKIGIRYDRDTHQGLIVDSDTLKEWEEADDVYRKEVESGEVSK